MGLDTTHDAWHGAYSAFNRFRQSIAKAVGVDFPPHDDGGLDDECIYLPDGFREQHPGLLVLLMHSDCDGDMSPEDCRLIAAELRALSVEESLSGGHMPSVQEAVGRFAAGCEAAADAGERLEFR